MTEIHIETDELYPYFKFKTDIDLTYDIVTVDDEMLSQLKKHQADFIKYQALLGVLQVEQIANAEK